MKNGTIFVSLVQVILNKKLAGINSDPKTETTKISNLRKALDALRQEKSMSQKYTWAERDIVKGSREHIIGLLEDMHILFDGYPPRQSGPNYFENGPHIGKVYNQITRKPLWGHKEEKEDESIFELDSDTDKEVRILRI